MAIVKRIEEVPGVDLSDGAEVVNVIKQVLLGPADGAPTFAVRLFTLGPGGHTPNHRHPFEHGVIVLEGEGELSTPDGPRPLRAGSVALVPPDEQHQFRNTGRTAFKFLCIVPRRVEE